MEILLGLGLVLIANFIALMAGLCLEARAIRKVLQARWDYERGKKIYCLEGGESFNHEDCYPATRALLQKPYPLPHTSPKLR